MSVGFGFSVGDIIACGKLCHTIYKSCFSDTQQAVAVWEQLGREVQALGIALTHLTNNNFMQTYLSQDIHDESNVKERQALTAVQVIAGDFKLTLNEFAKFLMKYNDFTNPEGGANYWLRVQYVIDQNELDSFRKKIAGHTRAVNLLITPLTYDKVQAVLSFQKEIHTTVSNLENRITSDLAGQIDNIKQVLGGILRIMSSHLRQQPYTHRQTNSQPYQIPDQRPELLDQTGANPYAMLCSFPENYEHSTQAAYRVKRSVSRPIAPLDCSPDSIASRKINDPTRVWTLPRRTSEEDDQYPSTPRRADSVPTIYHSDNNPSRNQALPYLALPQPFSPPRSGTGPFRPPRPPQVATEADRVNTLGAECIFNTEFKKQMEASTTQNFPIENWITAAMHWYFKAERELEETPNSNSVSIKAYMGIMKSAWIIENIIGKSESSLSGQAEIRTNIEKLGTKIIQKFGTIEGRMIPDIENIEPEHYEIWIPEIKAMLVNPSPSIGSISGHTRIQSNLSIGDSNSHPTHPHSNCLSYNRQRGPGSATSSLPEPSSSVSDPGSSAPRRRNHPSDSTSQSIAGKPPNLDFSETDQFSKYVEAQFSPTVDVIYEAGDPHTPNILGGAGWPLSGLSSKRNSQGTDSSDLSSDAIGSNPENYIRGLRSSSISSGSNSSGREGNTLSPRSSYTPGRSIDSGTTGLAIIGLDQGGYPLAWSTSLGQYERFRSELPGEIVVLEETEIEWSNKLKGKFSLGKVKIFWSKTERHFRIFTTWIGQTGTQKSDGGGHEFPRKVAELVPEYAYESSEDRQRLYVVRTLDRAATKGTRSFPTSEDLLGFAYKFKSSEDMLSFQAALTGETVFLDFTTKRIRSVRYRIAKRDYEAWNARLQLSHEKSGDALIADSASANTGWSRATQEKLRLRWSRMTIYFPGWFYITCFLTDDITLKTTMEERSVKLIPTRYPGTSLFRNPNGIKALMVGDSRKDIKGTIRLDKNKISPDDQEKFDNFEFIQITFDDAKNLKTFIDKWKEMMAARRANRIQIDKYKESLRENSFVPEYSV